MYFTTIIRDLNCQAIHLLTEGHFQRANAALGSALEQLRATAASSARPSCRLDKEQGLSFLYSTPLTTNCYDCIQGEFIFYDKAFLLDDLQRSCYMLNFDRQLEIATSVVLYNMAVTYHLHGVLRGESSALQRAAHLYDLCTQAVEESTIDYAPVVQKLLLAAFNNMGHINSLFFERERVSSCKGTVAVIMSGLDLCYLSADEVDFFHLSLFVCSDSLKLNTAPAA